MPIRGIGFVAGVTAWDTAGNEAATGEAGNTTLHLIRDGIAAPADNAPEEVDAANCPGELRLTVTDAEADCATLTVAGTSTTADVAIIPRHYVMDPLYGSKASLTLEDGDGYGVVGVRVLIYQDSGGLVVTGTTTTGGAFTCGLPDGAYEVVYGPAPLYSFSNPYALTVSGDTTATHECEALSIPASVNPELCTCYLDMRDVHGALLGENEGWIEVRSVESPLWPAAITDGDAALARPEDKLYTDTNGRVEIELVRGAIVLLRVEAVSEILNRNDLRVEVPDAASLDLSTL